MTSAYCLINLVSSVYSLKPNNLVHEEDIYWIHKQYQSSGVYIHGYTGKSKNGQIIS